MMRMGIHWSTSILLRLVSALRRAQLILLSSSTSWKKDNDGTSVPNASSLRNTRHLQVRENAGSTCGRHYAGPPACSLFLWSLTTQAISWALRGFFWPMAPGGNKKPSWHVIWTKAETNSASISPGRECVQIKAGRGGNSNSNQMLGQFTQTHFLLPFM